jgi:hypothetical protein
LLPGIGALLLRGIGTPGVHRVNVAIEQEVQDQYETHRRWSLKLLPGAGNQQYLASALELEPRTL